MNKGLLEASKRMLTLCRLLTVRQVIEGGDEAIDAAGLNPWCINEGLAEGHESIGLWWAEVAISDQEAAIADAREENCP